LLGASACPNVSCDFQPVLAEEAEAFQELLVFFLSPGLGNLFLWRHFEFRVFGFCFLVSTALFDIFNFEPPVLPGYTEFFLELVDEVVTALVKILSWNFMNRGSPLKNRNSLKRRVKEGQAVVNFLSLVAEQSSCVPVKIRVVFNREAVVLFRRVYRRLVRPSSLRDGS